MSHWANTIHAKALELVKIGFGSTFKTYRQTPMLQVQPGDLPILAVHLLRERREPDGQPNQTVPKFVHNLTLGFSGAVHVETDKQEDIHALEGWMSTLDDILLSDPNFVRLTEGVLAMDRVGQYAKVGETTLFEIRIEMNLQFRSDFQPRVPDELKVVHIETQFPDKAHAEIGTPQLDRVYDIETST
ncbi:hypothetical protein [Bradyrhizobium sp. S3.9.1]|uniref:hypothetical protein n=1 Tax=Bradyrhizobium sp. S3.9.1 TaxID=3156431 RepID=UPI00339B89E2